jgi:hypothetical protein
MSTKIMDLPINIFLFCLNVLVPFRTFIGLKYSILSSCQAHMMKMLGESHTHHLLLLSVVGLLGLLQLMLSEMRPSRYCLVLSISCHAPCLWYNGLTYLLMMHSKCSQFQVILLESRDRIGGRVHTDYSFGFPVDLGASWWVYPFFRIYDL